LLRGIELKNLSRNKIPKVVEKDADLINESLDRIHGGTKSMMRLAPAKSSYFKKR